MNIKVDYRIPVAHYFALLYSYLSSSGLTWGRITKTMLLPLIRLHTKAVRARKLKTDILSSK